MFPLMLVRKANTVEGNSMRCVIMPPTQPILHVTDHVTMTSLYANLLQKISAGKDHLCQITLN